MGQRPDEIEGVEAFDVADQYETPGPAAETMGTGVPAGSGDVTWNATEPAVSSFGDADTQSVDVVVDTDADLEARRQQIEQRRAEMSNTIDAIQERLSPATLAQQAKDTVRDATIGRVEDAASSATDTARDVSVSIVDTVKENPIPAALAGLGIGWLLMRRQSARQTRSYTPRYDYRSYGYQRPYSYEQGYGYASGRASSTGYSSAYTRPTGYEGQESEGGVVDTAKQTVSDFAGQVQDTASQAASQVQSQVSQIGDSAQQMAGNVGGTAQDVGSTILDTIRANPIPAALAGIGLGWLLMGRQGGNETTTRQYDYGRTYPRGYQSPYVYQGEERYYRTGSGFGQDSSYGQSGQNVVGQAQDAAGQAMDTVQDTAGQVANQVRDTAGQFADQAQQQIGQLGSTAQQAAGGFDRMMHENPLAVGAGALALGLVVGLSIPETPQEDRLMGPAREAVGERAQQVVQETAQKVQTVAQEAVGAARDQAERENLV